MSSDFPPLCNGAIAPLIPGDVYLAQGTFTGDVQLGTGSYINMATTPTTIVPVTVTVGDAWAELQFFAVDGGMGAAYAPQQSTTVVGVPLSQQSSPVGGTILYNTTAVGGYTFPQVVQCLINYGLLAGTSNLGTN